MNSKTLVVAQGSRQMEIYYSGCTNQYCLTLRQILTTVLEYVANLFVCHRQKHEEYYVLVVLGSG